jgi:glycosyltransferase involved in cell wall biosynthesis
LHGFRPQPGEYLAFLGRISPEKRVDRAIEIAIRAGQSLKIAAKVDRADREYFYEQIEPLLKHPLVEFVGEVGGRDKDEFLSRASALLMPIDWPEPFGLCMIEAMACGVPVIAWRKGSVPEVIDEGVTGFIVDNIDEAVRAVQRITSLCRRRCRETFERRFSAARMCEDYVAIYERLLAGSSHNGYGRRAQKRNAIEPRRLETATRVARDAADASRRRGLIPDVAAGTPLSPTSLQQ